MMLNEDNKSILDLVNYIDSKIVVLRKDNKFSKNIINSLLTKIETLENNRNN